MFNMKNIFLIFLILFILSINSVFALTEIPNANNTDVFKYSNNTFIDNEYTLSVNDSLTNMIIVENGIIYPFSQTFNFKDNKNNKK